MRWILCATLLLMAPLSGAEPFAPELDELLEIATSNAVPGKSDEDAKFLETWIHTQLRENRITPEQARRFRRMADRLRSPTTAPAGPRPEKKKLLEDLKALLQKQIVDERASHTSETALALFHLFCHEPEQALKLFKKSGPASSTDPYHPLLMAYTYIRLGDYSKGRAFLDEARQQILPQAPLRLSEPVLCSAINGFRLYTRIKDKSLKAGDNVFLYMEMSGVRFRKSGNESYSCDLNFGIVIKDELQNVIWNRPQYGAWSPTYQGPLRDMHTSVYVRLPSPLPAGQYHLFLTCHDRIARRKATTTTGFAIGGAAPPVRKAVPAPGDAETDNTQEPSFEQLQKDLKDMKDKQKQSDEINRRALEHMNWKMLHPNKLAP